MNLRDVGFMAIGAAITLVVISAIITIVENTPV